MWSNVSSLLRSPRWSRWGVGRSSTLSSRAALRDGGAVVWLRARPETLARRVGGNVERPLLAADVDGPAAALVRIEAERRPLYEEVAGVVIDVDDLTPPDVAERVLELGATLRREGSR